jgi:serine/threonine protein kinase
MEKAFPPPTAITKSLWEFHKHFAQLSQTNVTVRRFEDQLPFFPELRGLLILKHPCIIGLVEFSFPTRSNPAIVVTEDAEDQSLDDAPLHTLSETLIGTIMLEIVLGMQFIPASQMLHGNLIPSNILLDSDWRPRISGFTKCQWGVKRPGLRKNDVLAFLEILRKLLRKRDPGFQLTREHLERSAQEEPAVPPINRMVYEWQTSLPTVSFDDIFLYFQEQEFKILPNCDSVRLASFVHKVHDWETAFLSNYSY